MLDEENRFLSLIEPNVRAVLDRHLLRKSFAEGRVLAKANERVSHAYFPLSGVISCVVELKNGKTIEAGMIGNDGLYGGSQALDDKLAVNKAVVHAPLEAFVIAIENLRSVADRFESLRELLVKYEQFILAQVQQTAACNAVHDVRQRASRWLLRISELVGPNFNLNQQRLSDMIGVRRTSITSVEAELMREGAIKYSRGDVEILDRKILTKIACECHDTVVAHRKAIFKPIRY